MTLNQLIGIGLRHPHYKEIMEGRPAIGWFEVHSENFFHLGGPTLETLKKIRDHYPLSLHGVGLSLGSASGLDREHLKKIKHLINQVNPFLISDHLSWGKTGNLFLPDLLPLPYTQESLSVMTQNVIVAQDYLQRELLIENPSSYLEYLDSEISEAHFLVELCEKTGAKILLDINNIYVSACNHGWDAKKYIDAIPSRLVKELHLAGHSTKMISPTKTLRIDTHNNKICEAVWELYAYGLGKLGEIQTLIEWDADIPEFSVLIAEAKKAQAYCDMNIANRIKHAKA